MNRPSRQAHQELLFGNKNSRSGFSGFSGFSRLRRAGSIFFGLLIGLSLLVSTPGVALACGSYQTCNDVFILKFDATPQIRTEGDSVHVALHSFQFSDWYYTISTMSFPVVALGKVAGREIAASTSRTMSDGPYRYGTFYNWFYVQNTEWDSSFDWDGKDANQQVVSDAGILQVNVSAGAATAMRVAALFTTAGKDLGKPSCGEGNPCNPANGNKYQEQVDYAGAALIPGFTRHYNHMGGGDLGLGVGWTSDWHKSLRQDGDKLTALRADGRRERLTYIDGAWVADADSRLRVVAGAAGYALTLDTGTLETYGADGRLLSETDARGRKTTLVYDSARHLAEVAGPLGQKLVFSWSQNRVSSLLLPSGAVIQYAYDSSGSLITLTWPDNTTRRYVYENADYPHALTGIIDENNVRFATWTYGGMARVTSSSHAGGADLTNFAYAAGGAGLTQTTVTMPGGVQRDYTFSKILGASHHTQITQANGAGAAPVLQVTRDATGNIASRRDPNGNLTNYVYDLARNLETSRVEAAGTAQARTISTGWHPSYRLPLKIAEPLRLTTFAYDAGGNLQSVAEQASDDANGSAGFAANAAGLPRARNFTYNALGQVLSASGPRTDLSDLTSYTYDSNGNLSTVSNALGHVTAFSDYDANGMARAITDPNGVVTTLSYNQRGWLTAKVVGGESTTFQYDAVGQIKSVTQPDNSVIAYGHDDAHRLIRITDGLGNSIGYTLDALGNRIGEQVKDPGGALARQVSRVFNGLNQLQQASGGQQANSYKYQYDANGNRTQIADPLDRVSLSQYDALDRQWRVTDPGNGVTQYAYDALDRLTQVTDPRNVVTRYVVDGLGRQTALIGADAGTSTQTHDAADNVLTRTDAKGQTSAYQYDALNRIVRIGHADGQVTAYVYDLGANGIGRLSRITDATGSTEYAYDLHGRVTGDTRMIGGQSVVTSYRYDAAGRLRGLTYPTGRSVEIGRDSLGRVTQIASTKNGVTRALVTAVSYQAFGPAQMLTFGNGQTYGRGYDLDGRTKSYTLNGQVQAITHDAAGRITAIAEADNAANATLFGYDALDRLTAQQNPAAMAVPNQSYGYDAGGNRVSFAKGAASSGYVVDPASNRLMQITGSQAAMIGTDANGGITAKGAAQFQYDARGRLVSASDQDGQAQYQVNALGQRVKKILEGASTTYHYDLDGKLISEVSGRLVIDYVYLNDILVAVLK